MNTERLSNVEIRTLGWKVLLEKLGPAGALRFALLTERGSGDYAETRHRQLGALSVEQLVERMGKTGRKKRRK